MTEPDFKLTESEIHTSVWKKVSEHFELRLDSLRDDNDCDLDQIKTANLRGRLKEIKYLLGIAHPELPVPLADNDE